MLDLSFDCTTITFRETRNNLIYDRDACMATAGGRKVLLTKETAVHRYFELHERNREYTS